MQGSRELEVTRKTKFRPGKEESIRKGGGGSKKNHNDRRKESHKGFDMWGEDLNDGC